ncbi:hypothetical protein BD410DRAFT_784910 [Rickenella mellea]|uniref:Uncharacterized protein n=1 Tax=Rickenella mellea TaxID=50990 RepID=A0A4Y7QE18_9AGAM|nr:hypothetical protein BD410DRAFT_784910 [Rickenella mellea]
MSSISKHTFKQLKFVIPGGVVTFLLDSHSKFWYLVHDADGWARISAQTSLSVGLLTIALFLYILLIPWIKGSQPNYHQWRQSGELSVVVPLLTALMSFGWPLLTFTFSKWTDLGVLQGVMASSAIYALVFGLLGLVPAPMVKRQ